MTKDRTKLESIPVAVLHRADIEDVLVRAYGWTEERAANWVSNLSDEQFTKFFGKNEWQSNEAFMDTFWLMLEWLIDEAMIDNG